MNFQPSHTPPRNRHEFMPGDAQPQGIDPRALQALAQQNRGGPTVEEVLANPAILAGLMSLGTGRPVQLPVYGPAGRSYITTFVRNGSLPPQGWDLRGLGGV